MLQSVVTTCFLYAGVCIATQSCNAGRNLCTACQTVCTIPRSQPRCECGVSLCPLWIGEYRSHVWLQCTTARPAIIRLVICV